jgi:catechol 2,3-dioxygenase-like lactoylglutathione lyase family enzyme
VSDLERSAHFYRDTLGMPEVARFPPERPAFWVKAAPGTYLGLWKPEAGGPGVGVKGSRGGLHVHLAFLAPQGQLEAIEKRLLEAGYTTASWVRFKADQLSLFVDDPDGNVIEFADWSSSWEHLPVER